MCTAFFQQIDTDTNSRISPYELLRWASILPAKDFEVRGYRYDREDDWKSDTKKIMELFRSHSLQAEIVRSREKTAEKMRIREMGHIYTNTSHWPSGYDPEGAW